MKAVFLDFATLGPADLDTSELNAHLPDLSIYEHTSDAELIHRIAAAEILLVNKISLSATALAAAPKLKLICLAATGSDNIDLKAAAAQGITVCNIRDYCTASVVQHVFALILTLTQHLENYRDQVRTGEWQRSSDFCLLSPPIRELRGKTLGLIGLGTLGGGVAAVARAFGMRVIAARLPWRTAAPAGKDGQSAPRIALEALLEQADIVSLHCPLNDDTRHIIDAYALGLMKSDALLINTARGGLVDSNALLDELTRGELGGAGIDVLEEEPPVSGNALIDARLDNLIVTPHIAWSAREARQNALDEMMANILAFAAGESRNRLV
jgi:glycerate dehydrogenase